MGKWRLQDSVWRVNTIGVVRGYVALEVCFLPVLVYLFVVLTDVLL